MTLFATGAEPGTPYWWDGIDWPELSAAPPSETDLLVIGAGYTGLSAAIAAHDAGASVAVIDAQQPGHGASTRNGGMFGAHPRLSWNAFSQKYGAAVADAVFAEAATALDFAKDLIVRERIECDLQNTGRIQLAWSKAHFAEQKKLAAVISEKSDVAVRTVERAELDAEIRTQKYKGGMVFADHCGIHPAKFHQGLLNAALARGISICAPVEAKGVAREAGHFSIATSYGPIKAGQVVLATNGYTPHWLNWFSRRVFPLPSYIIATEPLPKDLLAQIAPAGRMMVETRARQSYFRISPDGTRVLYGGRAAIVDIPLKRAARQLRGFMAEVWPHLADVKLSHVWTGNTGYSFTHVPQVGVQDGIHFAMGYSGSGTVLAPYLGAKVAWRALGDPRAETAYSKTPFATSWMHHGGRPHFLQAADRWYRHVVDRIEAYQGR